MQCGNKLCGFCLRVSDFSSPSFLSFFLYVPVSHLPVRILFVFVRIDKHNVYT